MEQRNVTRLKEQWNREVKQQAYDIDNSLLFDCFEPQRLKYRRSTVERFDNIHRLKLRSLLKHWDELLEGEIYYTDSIFM